MKGYALVFLVLLKGFCYSQTMPKSEIQFKLIGFIEGNKESTIVLRYYDIDGKYTSVDCEIKDGRFSFEGLIRGATLASLSCETISSSVDDPNFVEIFLEPTIIEVYLVINKFKEAIVLGSKTHSEWDVLRNQLKPLKEKVDSVYSLFIDKNKSMDSIISQAEISILENEIDAFKKQLLSLNKARKDVEIKFIKENPGSNVSAELLFYCALDLTYDSLMQLYEKLDSNVLESRSGANISQLISKISNSQVGAKAPDFTIVGVNSDTIRLSKITHEKVVILEFWASWCQPCRSSFPQLKEMRKVYNNRELEIIGISRDLDEKAWKRAIEEDEIDKWLHCSVFEDYRKDEKGMFVLNEIEHKYYIPGLPLTILIDKGGIIRGFYFGKSNENFKDLKEKISTLIR